MKAEIVTAPVHDPCASVQTAVPDASRYRGRLAPSPTGYLHLGHARTFWTAQQRASAARGILVLRNEDLDRARVRGGFVTAMLEDLRWFGFAWQEGPDVGGPHAPYNQSQRRELHLAAFGVLRATGAVYPCTCSRRDVEEAAGAPHEAPPGEAWAPDEPVYPGTCRPDIHKAPALPPAARAGVNWRFRVPDGTALTFTDGHYGTQAAVAGSHFGDFIVWRKDDTPAYQLACVVDDSAMRISEVVRGADLLLSTFRQLLLYSALGIAPPAFFHCPLVTNVDGTRLAKRHDSLSLRALRAAGRTPEELRQGF
jgi:glutamyl/glutaminyl-tRNA synthetase